MSYYNDLDELRKNYFKILSPDFPDWLLEYIETDEMKRLSGISMLCGTDYSKMYEYLSFNSVLDHSVGVALMIWNFTHDKKQTIAGLFHDISTPTFKHCIDFMNGDSEHQESTEERTEQTIRNSKRIMGLLQRDGIKVDEISDYHLYPIADNDTPKLSADRFEYTFSNGLFLYGAWGLSEVERIYNDISVLKNEDGVEELGFNTFEICKDFLMRTLPVFATYDSDKNRLVMQFFADLLKSFSIKNYISVDDLYEMSEQDVINLIKNCEDDYLRGAFEKFVSATTIYADETPQTTNYCTSVKGKKRFIVPLVNYDGESKRIVEVDDECNKAVADYKTLKRSKWIGFDFEFKPYQKTQIVTICGSMRYSKEMQEIAWELEAEKGYCVIQCVYSDGKKLTEQGNENIVNAHWKKIDICDMIYVVNINGYIGESTQNEINYAISHGKKIVYHETLK